MKRTIWKSESWCLLIDMEKCYSVSVTISKKGCKGSILKYWEGEAIIDRISKSHQSHHKWEWKGVSRWKWKYKQLVDSDTKMTSIPIPIQYNFQK